MVEEAEFHDQGRRIKISHPGYLAASADFVENYYFPFLAELTSGESTGEGGGGRKEKNTCDKVRRICF